MVVVLGIALALALAANIGSNNAGVTMAPAFGAGARSRWASLALFAVFALAGAALLGDRVVRTLGEDLFTADLARHPLLFLVVAPGVTLGLVALANLLRAPVPTTPLAVCSLLGIGLAFGVVRSSKALEVVGWWLLSPAASLALTWAAGRLLARKFPRVLDAPGPRAKRWIGLLLTVEGCYSAFAIGSNNVANSMAPLVGGEVVGLGSAVWLGGAAMAAGALAWGGGVLDTLGKGITELCPARALVVGAVAATGLLVGSLFGIPLSGACLVTGGVMGFSLATSGAARTAANLHVRRIAVLWTTGPAAAVGMAYAAVTVLR